MEIIDRVDAVLIIKNLGDDDEQLFITPIRYEIICCHYTDGARNGV